MKKTKYTTSTTRKKNGKEIARDDIKFIGYRYKGKIYRTEFMLSRAMKKGRAGTVATPIYKILKKKK